MDVIQLILLCYFDISLIINNRTNLFYNLKNASSYLLSLSRTGVLISFYLLIIYIYIYISYI